MSCIFCKIASGEIKSSLVAENGDFVAFDDINPVAPCHVLVIPKRHMNSMSELSDLSGDALSSLFVLIDTIAVEKGVKASGFRVVSNQGRDGGQEVEHLHFHVVGGRKMGKIG